MNDIARQIVNPVPHNNSLNTGVCRLSLTEQAAKGEDKQQVNTTAHSGQEISGKKILLSVRNNQHECVNVGVAPQKLLPTPEIQIDLCDIDENCTKLARLFMDSQSLTVNGVDIDSEDLTESMGHEDIENLLFGNNTETKLSIVERLLGKIIPAKLERARIEGVNPLG